MLSSSGLALGMGPLSTPEVAPEPWRFRAPRSTPLVRPRVPLSTSAGSDPPHPGARRGPHAIGELPRVMSDVADRDHLVLELGDLVPVEAALRAAQIERVDRVVDDAVAEV